MFKPSTHFKRMCLKLYATNFYAEDAQFLPANHPAIVGRLAIQRAFEALIANGLQKLVLRTDKIEVAGDFAYGIGRHQMTSKPLPGLRSTMKASIWWSIDASKTANGGRLPICLTATCRRHNNSQDAERERQRR